MTAALTALLLVLATTAGAADYDRRAWKHWIDADGDGQDTRAEVLVRDLEPGGWHDPYTGRLEPAAGVLDLDHLVPLREAYQSGGVHWSAETREAYANALADPDHLVLTHRRWNRQKGARDPATWMPPACTAGHLATCCWYAASWVRVKLTWGMTMDPAERTALVTHLAACPRPNGTSAGGGP